MKRCPQCRTTYADDDTLNFCLEDGEWLVADDQPATAILSPSGASFQGGFAASPTRQQIHTTASTKDPGNSFGNRERQRGPAHVAESDKNSGGGFDKRPLLAPAALALCILAGFAGFRYFGSDSSARLMSSRRQKRLGSRDTSRTIGTPSCTWD